MTADVALRLVDDLMGENEGKPGYGKWWSTPTGRSRGLHFYCPCGCGALLGVNVNPGGERGSGWNWNGDRERPTFTPSIQHSNDCRWHGFLTDGVFRTC